MSYKNSYLYGAAPLMYPPDLVPILPQPPPLLHYEPLSPTPVLGTQLIEVSPTHYVLSWQAPVEHSYKLSTQGIYIHYLLSCEFF